MTISLFINYYKYSIKIKIQAQTKEVCKCDKSERMTLNKFIALSHFRVYGSNHSYLTMVTAAVWVAVDVDAADAADAVVSLIDGS